MPSVDHKHEQGLLNFFEDENVVQQFKKLDNPEQMIQFMWKVPSFQNFLRGNSEQIFGKSDGDTRRFREMGNKLFKAGKDEEAIKMFNKAIMKAPVNDSGKGRDLSLAIANRSAALLKLGVLKGALEDIEFAFVSGYPTDLRYKLCERKIKILIQLKENDSALHMLDQFKLAMEDSTLEEDKKCKLKFEIETLLQSVEHDTSQPSNSEKKKNEKSFKHKLGKSHSYLPSLSVSVSIEYSPARGRFAVASRDIPAGEVILVEQAVVNISKEDQGESYCDFCLKKVHLRLVPCKCCAHVGYCSDKCLEDASESHHKYECGHRDMFSQILDNIKTDGTKRMGNNKDMSKLCYRAIAQKPLSWYKENRESLFAENPKFGDESYDKTPQHSLLNLVAHQDRLKPERLWWFLISAVCHLRAFQMSGYFGTKKLKTPAALTDDELYIGGLLVHVIQMMQFNTHGIDENTDSESGNRSVAIKDLENELRLIGTGLYPTFALFNHSCDNNTYKYYTGSSIVVVASKNIFQGEEVTETYFPSARMIPRPQRRAWLADNFWFDCQCSACLLDQPTLEKISKHCQNFCCHNEKCKGIVQVKSNCPVCGEIIDVDENKMEIEKIRESLESLRQKMKSNRGEESRFEIYKKTTEFWIRLQKLARHPYRLLYTAEQQFWEAVRLSQGNNLVKLG